MATPWAHAGSIACRGSTTRALILLAPCRRKNQRPLPGQPEDVPNHALVVGFWRKPTRPTFAAAEASMLGIWRARSVAPFMTAGTRVGRAGCEAGFWFVDPHRSKWVDTLRITCQFLWLPEPRIVYTHRRLCGGWHANTRRGPPTSRWRAWPLARGGDRCRRSPRA